MDKIRAASKSTLDGCNEFVVHVTGEYDYRFICGYRDELIAALKKVYFDLTNSNLPVYGIPKKSLKEIETSKADIKKGIIKPIDEQYRLKDEEVFQAKEDFKKAEDFSNF